MTTYTVSSGVTSSGLLIQGGDSETVLSGGTAINTGVDGSQAVQTVDAGGTAISTTVDLDSLEQELSGGTTVGTVVNSGGEVTVNGLASGSVVNGAGLEAVYDGGTEIGATLSGGMQIVGVSGTASATLIIDGGAQAVGEGSGGTVTGTVVADGVQEVGGTVTYEYFYGGGVSETVNLSGGVATSTIVSGASAVQTVSAGGTAISTTVEAYGTQYVYSGGTASNTTLGADSLGAELTGGITVGTVVNSAGEEETTGLASGSVVSSGGLEAVYSGGTEINATLSGGMQIVGVSGTASGTLIVGGGTQYVGQGTVGTVTGTVVTDGTQQVGGTVTYDYYYGGGVSETVNLSGGVATGTTVTGVGAVQTVDVGGVASGTTVDGGGTEIVSSGGTADGVTISGGTFDILSGGSATGGITFAGSGGALDVGAPSLGATISGFATGDTIDLENVAFTGATSATITGGVATITEGATTYTLNFASADDGDTLYTVSDGTNGTDVILCFYPGTRIATPSGETAVEALRAGDLVRTMNGDLPVRWIGESHVSTRFADPLRTLPIRIKAGALADHQPERDLLVSPDHAILLDGILIQASALVNGVSIIREQNVPERFTYYHVELATHELLLAEGTPAESFVDNVHRMAFHNWDEHEALHEDAPPIAEMSYPRALSHRQVPVDMRSRLAVRTQLLFERVGQQAA